MRIIKRDSFYACNVRNRHIFTKLLYLKSIQMRMPITQRENNITSKYIMTLYSNPF